MKNIKLGKHQKGFFTELIAAAPLIGSALSFLGGERSNTAQTNQANQANAISVEEAQKNRDFQRDMSNTAHQREAKDLKKAGLNRILTVARGSGASTGAGAQAVGQQANIKDTLSPAVGNAANIARVQADIKLAEAQTAKITEEKDILSEQRKPKLNLLTLDVSTAQKIFDSVLPETITQAKQKTIINALDKIVKDIQIDSDREKYVQLKTKLVEAKTKEEFYRILGKNIHMLAPAGKVATIAGTLFAIWKTFSPPGKIATLTAPLLKNARKSDFGKSMRRHGDNLKNFSKKYSRKFFEQ